MSIFQALFGTIKYFHFAPQLRFYGRGKLGLGTGVKRLAQDHTAGQWRAGVGIQIQVRGRDQESRSQCTYVSFNPSPFLASFWQIALGVQKDAIQEIVLCMIQGTKMQEGKNERKKKKTKCNKFG